MVPLKKHGKKRCVYHYRNSWSVFLHSYSYNLSFLWSLCQSYELLSDSLPLSFHFGIINCFLTK
jgi:hypothetical protein